MTPNPWIYLRLEDGWEADPANPPRCRKSGDLVSVQGTAVFVGEEPRPESPVLFSLPDGYRPAPGHYYTQRPYVHYEITEDGDYIEHERRDEP